MHVSLRWLKDVFPNDLSVADIVEKLTLAGLEVEDVRDLGMGSGRIVVAKVLEVSRHPDADKLSLVKADTGEGAPADIVCGAPNVRAGMFVPCALPGAELPGGMKIKKSKIRGQESAGMLCSGKELGLGTDHSGILELPDTWKIGEPFECIIEIKVTPNRADCLSMNGIARDLAAMVGHTGCFFYLPQIKVRQTSKLKIEEIISVEVRDPAACPFYTCGYMKDLRVEASPLWLRRTLEASGLRPINNIVDVTNYVMLEFGAPMHAFDFEKLIGGRIVVRPAADGETLETLDGRTITLHPEDLVIADAERPIALAGVMGGSATQVTEATRQVTLECACFAPEQIRKSARRHGFNTDASYRFERGVDRLYIKFAQARAAFLIEETSGGEVASDVISIGTEELPPMRIPRFPVAHVNDLLGVKLTEHEIIGILLSLGFETYVVERDKLAVIAPTWRMDMELPVDVIEEIARIYGYDRIPETMPGIRPNRKGTQDEAERLLRKIRALLVSLGFSETVHYSFTSEALAQRAGFDPAEQPRVANPLTVEQAIMRPSLLGQLPETAAFNQRMGAERVAIFEIGKTFSAGAQPGHEEHEGKSLAIVLSGSDPSNWAAPARELDFYDLKGVIETLGEAVGLGGVKVESGEAGNVYHPGRNARASWKGVPVGTFGELHPDLIAAYDLKGRVLAAELDLAKIIELAQANPPKFKPIPKFPASQRDLAVLIDADMKADKLVQTAMKLGRPLVEELSIVDVYTGQHIPEGKKSLAIRMRLRNPETTLTEEEINGVMEKVIGGLKEQCGATLRS